MLQVQNKSNQPLVYLKQSAQLNNQDVGKKTSLMVTPQFRLRPLTVA
jgi:P pilus assembly chaperone PapD